MSWTIDEISGQKLENFIQENDGKAESEDTLPLGPVQSLELEEVLTISRCGIQQSFSPARECGEKGERRERNGDGKRVIMRAQLSQTRGHDIPT